jgi:hypothetical protein
MGWRYFPRRENRPASPVSCISRVGFSDRAKKKSGIGYDLGCASHDILADSFIELLVQENIDNPGVRGANASRKIATIPANYQVTSLNSELPESLASTELRLTSKAVNPARQVTHGDYPGRNWTLKNQATELYSFGC